MINELVSNGFQPGSNVRSIASAVPAGPSVPVEAEVAAPVQQQEATDPVKLQEAVTKLNDYVQNIQRTLSFSVDKETGRTVVKVYDSETNELIRQIPPEETVKLAASIGQQTASLFVKERA
jgi:flagellar protein FlaG